AEPNRAEHDPRRSGMHRLRHRARRAVRLVRELPSGLLLRLRPVPFLQPWLPRQRLPCRTLRPCRRGWPDQREVGAAGRWPYFPPGPSHPGRRRRL
ncbi:MAG: hypothetical protein AVDCRST_MAG19-1611, partial [uncultured Thermomicrobiales bacterium]